MPFCCHMLKNLVGCHSTPGDEDDVAKLLLGQWSQAGWTCQRHGRYAISATSPKWHDDWLTVMICAHMDSPGFIVQSVNAGRIVAVTLGGISADSADGAAVTVKTASGTVPARVWAMPDRPGNFQVICHPPISRGDRICFTPSFKATPEDITAPFLDNRLGCHQLVLLAEAFSSMASADSPQAVNIVLAATAQEEFTGFGAAVLANACKADLVICLDATYADEEQGVLLGNGPVLTISDKSVILGQQQAECILELCRRWCLPLQTEVYNYSGTDARAFPQQGCDTPVYPILLPTTGNHSPNETVRSNDIHTLQKLLANLCNDPEAVKALCSQTFV